LNSAAFRSEITASGALVVFDNNSFAAFVPSRFENEPATSSLHSRPKTVRFCAPAVIRLKGSLGHRYALLEKLQG
jgi:hypothetical protein